MEDGHKGNRGDAALLRLRAAELQERGATDRYGRNRSLLQLYGVPDTPGQRCPSIGETKNHESTLSKLLYLRSTQGNTRSFLSNNGEALGVIMP